MRMIISGEQSILIFENRRTKRLDWLITGNNSIAPRVPLPRLGAGTDFAETIESHHFCKR